MDAIICFSFGDTALEMPLFQLPTDLANGLEEAIGSEDPFLENGKEVVLPPPGFDQTWGLLLVEIFLVVTRIPKWDVWDGRWFFKERPLNDTVP